VQRVVNILASSGKESKSVVFDAAEVKALRVTLAPGEKSADCVVDAPVLLFVMDGKGQVIIEDETVPLIEGDVTVVPPGKNRYLQAVGMELRVLAVQSLQADKSCGLCALLESCLSIHE
jgi:quercetin dioxygenase-like cupin family protein